MELESNVEINRGKDSVVDQIFTQSSDNKRNSDVSVVFYNKKRQN